MDNDGVDNGAACRSVARRRGGQIAYHFFLYDSPIKSMDIPREEVATVGEFFAEASRWARVDLAEPPTARFQSVEVSWGKPRTAVCVPWSDEGLWDRMEGLVREAEADERGEIRGFGSRCA